MASTIMHIAVADKLYKKINSKININYYDYILGSIAPDISKLIGEDKKNPHFMVCEDDIPDIKKFLDKYINDLDNSFTLGYFIHLYTDKLFYRDYLPLFVQDDFLTSIVRYLDGNVVELSKEDRIRLFYNDYTNLNTLIIDEYELNLDLFYNEFIEPKTNITEIPIEKLELLIDNAGIIIENLSKEKNYVINISQVKSFIDDCVEEIYERLLSLEVIKYIRT